jgi:hypothetical protein
MFIIVMCLKDTSVCLSNGLGSSIKVRLPTFWYGQMTLSWSGKPSHSIGCGCPLLINQFLKPSDGRVSKSWGVTNCLRKEIEVK